MTPPIDPLDYLLYKLYLRYLILVQKTRAQVLHLRENPGLMAMYGTVAGGFILPVSIPVMSYFLSRK